MAALAGVFVWDEERIQEEELQRWARERAFTSGVGGTWGRPRWSWERRCGSWILFSKTRYFIFYGFCVFDLSGLETAGRVC